MGGSIATTSLYEFCGHDIYTDQFSIVTHRMLFIICQRGTLYTIFNFGYFGCRLGPVRRRTFHAPSLIEYGVAHASTSTDFDVERYGAELNLSRII